MKKRCILLLGVCILLLSLLSGCVNIVTDLTIDGNFSGTRKMTVSFDTLEAEQRITSGIEDIDHVIAEAKPEALSFYRSDSYNPTEYVFTLSFSSLEDYISKVESITGEDEDVQFSYVNKTFAKDIQISESFDSRDLFKWFEKVLIDNGFASETALADGALYTQTGVVINIDGERYSSGGGNVLVKDGSGNLVNKISISTAIDEEGLYTRYITFNLKPSMSSDDIGEITEFFTNNKPEGALVSQSSDADKYTFVVQFSAASEAELTKSTSMVFGGTAASASVSDYQDDSQPLSTFEALDESFDLSNFSQGEPVEFSYQIISDKGLPIAVYNVTAGDTESSAVQTGNTIEYNGVGTSVSLKTVFESISTAQCIDYNLIMLSPKQFVREIKIYMAAGTPTEVLDQIALYYKSKSAPLAEVSVDINGKLPFIAIVISGTPEQICSSESALFGVADRSLSYDRAGGVFSLRANSTLIDRFDISSLLSLTSSSSYIYTFVSEDTLISYTYNDEGSPITKDIPKSKDKEPAPVAMMLSDGSQSITYGGKYTNVTAIIFICLLAILMLLLAA
ncbi:MAG: hypothetical protein IJP17_03100, partial [Clostridia bacterium]|nr:hypothetical protein [Clostridia bacterium]